MTELRKSKCQSCGAPLNVLLYSRSVTCEYCGTIMHVTSDTGTDVALSNTNIKMQKYDVGPLHVGSYGFFERAPFKIIGVLEYQDDEGWKWQEYYINFKDGRKAWLEFDDGKYTMLLNMHLDNFSVPKVMLGSLKIAGVKVKVKESGSSRITYQWGQIPFTATPKAVIHYIDGKGKDGMSYSVEYTPKETEVFKGRKVDMRSDGQYIYLV